MKSRVIVDTDPLMAMLNGRDGAHGWVMQPLADMAPPLLSCEAVLAEATYLTRATPGARMALLEMVAEGFLSMGMQLAEQPEAVLSLVKRYLDTPMSLVHACLVRLAELNPKSAVFTLDSDFCT